METARERQAKEATRSFADLIECVIVSTRKLVDEGIAAGEADSLIKGESMKYFQQALSAMLTVASLSFTELAKARDKIEHLSAALDSQRKTELESSQPINEQAANDASALLNRILKGD